MTNSDDRASTMFTVLTPLIGIAIMASGIPHLLWMAKGPGPDMKTTLANKDRSAITLLSMMPMLQGAALTAVTAAIPGIPNFANATATSLVYGAGALLIAAVPPAFTYAVTLAVQGVVAKLVYYGEVEGQAERVMLIENNIREREASTDQILANAMGGIASGGGTTLQKKNQMDDLRACRLSAAPLPMASRKPKVYVVVNGKLVPVDLN